MSQPLTDARVAIHNRKYLGAKTRLLDFLEGAILSRSGPSIGCFVDAFSGTGAVADRFRGHAHRVVANDILYSNYVTNRAFLATDAGDLDGLRGTLDELNGLPGSEGYVFESYGGRYFTEENAALIDSRREAIESLAGRLRVPLLASLLYAADKVANTAGQYDAYLKSLGESAYDVDGRHRVDANAYGRLLLKMPLLRDGVPPAEVHNRDAAELVAAVEADVLYLDPPYNTRQYADLYHVLENIALWRKPELAGKTRKFDRSGLRSPFSSRRACRTALECLVASARARHIFLSYNSEGMIAKDEIVATLRRRGTVEVLETDYGVFGNGAGRSVKRRVLERLYHCRVER
jgi:adenine-specific DNA-methyltransferase